MRSMDRLAARAARAALATTKKRGEYRFSWRALTTAGGPNKNLHEKADGAPSAGGVRTKKTGGPGAAALKSFGIGTGAGATGSLVGMGGGFVAIPFLTGWLGLTQHQAHGTSLGAVFATGVAGSTAYALAGHVDYQIAGAMSLAGMAAAHAGARSTEGADGTTLKLGLGVLMLVVAPMLPLRDKLLPREGGDGNGNEHHPSDQSGALLSSDERHFSRVTTEEGGDTPPALDVRDLTSPLGAPPPPRGVALESGEESSSRLLDSRKVAKMFAIGAGSGFLAGVFGVGGGVLTVPAISLSTDLSHKEVLGTSLAAMVLPAFVGSVTHLRQGNLTPRIALPLALGTAAGAFMGGKYATRHLDEETLKLAFSCLLLFLGTKTIAGARAAAARAGKRAA